MKTKKRILFILHLPPPIHGSSVVGLQIKETKVINTNFDCRYINLGTSKTIYEIGKNTSGKILRYLSILCQVIINIIAHRPDICYLALTVKGKALYKDTIIILLVKMFHIRLIYHLHNKGVSYGRQKLIRNLHYCFVFNNTKVICLSPLLYSDIQKFVIPNNVYYCPNGLPNLVTKNKLAAKRIKKVTINILFLSNLIESKGVYFLLEACKILKDKQLNFQCTFVGGIGDVNECQLYSKIQKLNLENFVKYTGVKFGMEKESEFANADIFAFPSYEDCFPLVVLEAMKYSLPIISTFEGAIPTIVADGVTGFLVPSRDPVSLAEKLALLMTDSELRTRMGIAGRNKYENEFTLASFEIRMMKILHELTITNEL